MPARSATATTASVARTDRHRVKHEFRHQATPFALGCQSAARTRASQKANRKGPRSARSRNAMARLVNESTP